MKEGGLRGRQAGRRRYGSYKGTVGRIAPDTIGRRLEAMTPGSRFVSDITRFTVANTKVYPSQ